MTRGKLIAWLVLVGILTALAYASRIAGGKPPRDALYQYSLAISGLLEYAVLLGIVYWISRGLSRGTMGLTAPSSWPRALGLMVALLIGIVIAEQILEAILHAAREQGLEPTHWDSGRAAPFALNAFVVVVIAPIVEELTFRGLGFAVLRPFGSAVAVVGTAAAFAAVHGLVDGFLPLLVFGLAIGFLRLRTDSVYPGMLFHGFFNATALAIAFAH